MSDKRSEMMRTFLEWRGIDKPCEKCGGVGQVCYGSTATWRGGIGGQVLTNDVCDKCWGTGDATRSGANLRTMLGKLRALEMASSPELPPCRNCKRGPVAIGKAGKRWFLWCEFCNNSGDLCSTIPEAVKAWREQA